MHQESNSYPRVIVTLAAERSDLVQKSRWWNQHQVDTCRDKHIRELVNHAYPHTQWHREINERAGFGHAIFREKTICPDSRCLRRTPLVMAFSV